MLPSVCLLQVDATRTSASVYPTRNITSTLFSRREITDPIVKPTAKRNKLE